MILYKYLFELITIWSYLDLLPIIKFEFLSLFFIIMSKLPKKEDGDDFANIKPILPLSILIEEMK